MTDKTYIPSPKKRYMNLFAWKMVNVSFKKVKKRQKIEGENEKKMFYHVVLTWFYCDAQT